MKRILSILMFITLFIFFTCQSFDETEANKSGEYADSTADITGSQTNLLEVANSLIGNKPYAKVVVNNKTFTLDCIGTASAIYYGVGIDITKDFYRYSGNGVARLYHTLKERKLVHNSKNPKIGDIIFWDHTWDKNEDGIMGNDPLTHVGVVVNRDTEGNIYYIHTNYVKGVVVEKMNLLSPDVYQDENGNLLNSILAISSSLKKHPDLWLSGQLWKEFGTILGNEEQFNEDLD